MRSYQQAFGAGESKDFIIDAKYFFLFDANSAVTIQFWKNSAPSDDLALNVLSGFKCRPENGFDRVTIISSAAQTISFFISKGEGDYDRFIGNVNLLSAVSLDAAALAAIQNRNVGFSYGASYRSITELAANTAEQVFSAASNVNGAVLHDARFASVNAGTVGTYLDACFLTKATTPANAADGVPILTTEGLGGSAISASLKNPVRIPAGQGLFFISTLAETGASRMALYTLL